MRRESTADAIKRRMAEKDAARRNALNTAAGVAIWSGAIGFSVMMLAVVASAAGLR
jgi:hypothetical protein